MKRLLKDIFAIALFISIVTGSIYIFMISLDDHIAIENAKELEYQHYIYKESLR